MPPPAPLPPLSFPHSRRYDPNVGKWQMQDYPGAPGSARKGSTRTVVPAARGGAAAHPMAPGHDHPLATPVRLPGHDVRPWAPCRPSAAPRAPVADRCRPAHKGAGSGPTPRRAESSAAGPDHPRATPQAPGQDVPRATPARAPGLIVRAPRSWCRTTTGPTRAYGAARTRTWRAPARMCLSPPLRCRPA